jgi:hypothetical protein
VAGREDVRADNRPEDAPEVGDDLLIVGQFCQSGREFVEWDADRAGDMSGPVVFAADRVRQESRKNAAFLLWFRTAGTSLA